MNVLVATSVIFLGICGSAGAQYQTGSSYGGYGTGSNPNNHAVQGYTTRNGTYVQPHYQTNSNNTQFDNYGTRGNLNPYTGQIGTRRPGY